MCGAAANNLSKAATPRPFDISMSTMTPRTPPLWMRFTPLRYSLNRLDVKAFVNIRLQRLGDQARIGRMAFDQQHAFVFRLVHTAPRADALALSVAGRGVKRTKKDSGQARFSLVYAISALWIEFQPRWQPCNGAFAVSVAHPLRPRWLARQAAACRNQDA